MPLRWVKLIFVYCRWRFVSTEILVEKPTASLNDIAEHAGVGIATLHRYVESREQLILQLGLRAAKVVGETMDHLPAVEENYDTYIPALVEALIPSGDKIHFLTQDTSLCCNAEMLAAEEKILERVRSAIHSLQQMGKLRHIRQRQPANMIGMQFMMRGC